jgi:hypothetical protein
VLRELAAQGSPTISDEEKLKYGRPDSGLILRRFAIGALLPLPASCLRPRERGYPRKRAGVRTRMAGACRVAAEKSAVSRSTPTLTQPRLPPSA